MSLSHYKLLLLSQTDKDGNERETFFVSLIQMIYHFLANTIDIESSSLIDNLTARDILSPSEEQNIKKQKEIESKVRRLLMVLSRKSASGFENFLTTLSETGQQSVAGVVREALHTVGQAEHNPLHYARGKTTTCLRTARNRNIAVFQCQHCHFQLPVVEFCLSGRRGQPLPFLSAPRPCLQRNTQHIFIVWLCWKSSCADRRQLQYAVTTYIHALLISK